MQPKTGKQVLINLKELARWLLVEKAGTYFSLLFKHMIYSSYGEDLGR